MSEARDRLMMIVRELEGTAAVCIHKAKNVEKGDTWTHDSYDDLRRKTHAEVDEFFDDLEAWDEVDPLFEGGDVITYLAMGIDKHRTEAAEVEAVANDAAGDLIRPGRRVLLKNGETAMVNRVCSDGHRLEVKQMGVRDQYEHFFATSRDKVVFVWTNDMCYPTYVGP